MRRLDRSSATRSEGGSCPDENLLALYAEGPPTALSECERRPLEAHLRQCSDCWMTLEWCHDPEGPPEEESESISSGSSVSLPVSRRLSEWRGPLAAAAVLVLAWLLPFLSGVMEPLGGTEDSTVRTFGDKQFVRVGDVWTDRELTARELLSVTRVRRGSDAYRELERRHPELRAIARELGRFRVELDARAYEVLRPER